MRWIALSTVLLASTAHAGIGELHFNCDDTCAGIVLGSVGGVIVAGTTWAFLNALVKDDRRVLPIVSILFLAEYGLSAAVAGAMLGRGIAGHEASTNVIGYAAWLTGSIAMVGLGIFGLHRAFLPVVTPLPGGAAIGVAAAW